MSTAQGTPRYAGITWRLVSILIVSASIALLVAANAHLVYVALVSQPDCVPHTKAAGEKGAFRAARSAC